MIGSAYYEPFSPNIVFFLFLFVIKREKLFQFKSMHMILYKSIEHVQIKKELLVVVFLKVL